jgi:uncharacterized Zn-binding protein involved in type VI secretion
MANIAVDGDIVLDGLNSPVATDASGTGYGQSFFKVDGKDVVIAGTNGARVPDHFLLHTNVRFSKPDFFFKVNGASVIINGDAASCGHTITGTGFLNVG